MGSLCGPYRDAPEENGSFLESLVVHSWGPKPYNASHRTTENGWISLFAMGEGWHNGTTHSHGIMLHPSWSPFTNGIPPKSSLTPVLLLASSGTGSVAIRSGLSVRRAGR